jgi:photosystem II stability/assembly factor-like uncharacterized protein
MSNGFEKDLRDHLHRDAARTNELPSGLPSRIRRGIDSGGRFSPIQQLALVGAMLVFVALVGVLVVQLKGTRPSLPGQHNQGVQLPGFTCTDRTGGQATSPSVPTEYRAAVHGGYERLTFQFNGAAVPAYRLEQRPTSQFLKDASGQPVTLKGTAGLMVVFRPQAAPASPAASTEPGVYRSDLIGIASAMPTNLTEVQEVRLLGSFESVWTFGIGLANRSCFRVTELANPARLAIDFDTSQTSSYLQTATPVAKVPFQVQQLSFVDALHGWALGTASKGQTTYLLLARTSDGGATWHYLPFREPSIANAVGASWRIFFEDAQVGWLYGPNLYVTHDGGTTWVAPPSGPATIGLPALLALSASSDSVWAVTATQQCTTATGVGSCPPYLLVSTDGGRGWTTTTEQPVIVGAQAQIVRVSRDIGWILSWQPDRSSLATTRDGGATWQSLTTPCAPGTSFQDRMAAIDDRTIWVVCGSQPGAGEQEKQLITSTDGGRHWNYPPNPPLGGYVANLALSAPTNGVTGWLAMVRGPLYMTRDGGRTWTPADLRGAEVGPAGSGEIEVVFTDPLHGWAATSTAIFRTSDGGLHWTGVPAEALE